MKKTGLLFLGVVVIMLLAATVRAQGMGGMDMMDNKDMPMMGGMGMMGNGMGMGPDSYGFMGRGMGMMGPGAFGMLDLTAEQRTRINKIQDELRKQHWALMGKVMDEEARLRDLYDEDKLDAKKILAVSDAVHALRRQMLETRIDACNRMLDVLTKEQRTQFNTWRRRGRGMMGPGYRYGTMMGR